MARFGVPELGRVWQDARFLGRRREFLAPPTDPHVDGPTLELLTHKLRSLDTYVEYGSGGTTLFAARHAALVISIESDRMYRRHVARALREADAQGNVRLLLANVGPTAAWGYPILRYRERAISGRSYVMRPWNWLRSRGAKAPGLVFVDGRYRVACALAAAQSHHSRELEILVDDFANRPEYHCLLTYFDVVEAAGRSVLLRLSDAVAPSALMRLYTQALHDCR